MKKIRTSLLAILSILVFGSMRAELYSLSLDAIADVLPNSSTSVEKLDSYDKSFADGTAQWSLHLAAHSEITLQGISKSVGNGYFYTGKNDMSNCYLKTLSLSTNFFDDKTVTRVRLYMGLFRPTNSVDDGDRNETVELSIGGYDVTEVRTLQKNWIGKDTLDIVLNNPVSGDFSISFSNPSGARMYFRFLEVYYDEGAVITPEPVTVSRVETVAVGHPVMLQASSEEAVVFYTVDGSENWVRYNRERGVVFAAPGDYTLKYYAENGDVKSEVITEEVRVVKVAGIAAALQANNEIEVLGKVVGLTDRYVLIADDAEAALADCLAVESSDYAALKSARVGDVVKATGRATDKFGSEIKALGSISSLSVNNQASVPTNIAEVRAAMLRRDTAYDIQGRPATSRSRLIVTPSGAKELR